MKKSLIALAALGAFAGAASAQSSVTLFGILDTGIRAVRNGDSGTVKSLTSDGLSASRLGFRGEEDLGGGLKAGFWLEGRVGVDTGDAGFNTSAAPSIANGNGANTTYKFFNRRTTISLMGPFGEVRLGRDYLPSFLNLAAFDAYGAVGLGNVLNLVGSAAANYPVGTLGSGGNLVRADNSVGYILPANLGGLYGQVMAAMGEGTNQQNGNNGRYYGGRVGYAAGPFDVAAGYGNTRIPGNDDYRVWNLGGSFNFGVAKLSALYHRAEYTPAGLAQRSQRLWGIGANVPLGQGEFRATYQRSDLNGGTVVGLRDQDDARQYAVGYIYNLSKRTALYTDVSRLQNRGGSLLTIPGGTGVNFVGGQNSTAFAAGVRHSF